MRFVDTVYLPFYVYLVLSLAFSYYQIHKTRRLERNLFLLRTKI